MSSITTSPRTRSAGVLHPFPAALGGGALYAVAMTVGEAFGLNSDSSDAPSTTWTDIAAYAGLVLAAVALASWLGTRARAGTPDRLARYAVGLAVASAATFIVFWSGWPQVLGAVALVTALEHRRRVGSFGGASATAAGISGLVLAATTVICVVG